MPNSVNLFFTLCNSVISLCVTLRDLCVSLLDKFVSQSFARLSLRTAELVLFLLFGHGVNSQTTFTFSDSAVLSRFKTDICTLASDSFQGRNSGTEGERMAYEYLIRQFETAGLEPKGTDGSYLQPFPEISRTMGANTLSVSGKELRSYWDFGVMDFSGSGSASGVIVDAGSGIRLPDKDIDDYNGIDVTGKIVLLDLDVPRELTRDSTTLSALSPRKRCMLAFDLGAAAVICHDPYSYWGLGYDAYKRTDTLTKPVIYVTREIVDRIRKEGSKEVRLETRFSFKTETFHNVIGYIDNHAPYTVILGAHYDHVGIGTKTGLVRNGSDDNASGTAMITELARYYKAHPSKEYNFLILAFSGEEEGLKGSYWFASHPTISLDSVSFMFNFDMVGRLGCRENRVDAVCTATSPVWKQTLRHAPGKPFRVRMIPGAAEFSDHYPFYKENIPIAYLTTGMHYDYHSSRDDAEKINYTGMVSICDYARGIISECEQIGKVPFRKASGWNNFRSMLYYIGEELDYVMMVGMPE